MVTSCKTMVQNHNQDIDMHTIQARHGRLPHVALSQSHHFPATCIPSLTPGNHHSGLISIFLPFQEWYINEITQCVTLTLAFFSLSLILLRVFPLVEYIPFLLLSSILWYGYTSLTIHPLKDNFSCFQFSSVTHKDAINIHAQVVV